MSLLCRLLISDTDIYFVGLYNECWSIVLPTHLPLLFSKRPVPCRITYFKYWRQYKVRTIFLLHVSLCSYQNPFSIDYSGRRLIRTKKKQWFLSELSDRLNQGYILIQGVNGVCLEKLSELGGLSELLVVKLTDVYCTFNEANRGFPNLKIFLQTTCECFKFCSHWANNFASKSVSNFATKWVQCFSVELFTVDSGKHQRN